jgi:hypothetical protein
LSCQGVLHGPKLTAHAILRDRTEAVRSEPWRREPSADQFDFPSFETFQAQSNEAGKYTGTARTKDSGSPVPSQVAVPAGEKRRPTTPRAVFRHRPVANYYAGGRLTVDVSRFLLFESPLYLSQTTNRLFGLGSQSSILWAFARLILSVGTA